MIGHGLSSWGTGGTRGSGGPGCEGAQGGAMREGGHEKLPSLRYPTLYNTTDL